jgi:hypothetical protein
MEGYKLQTIHFDHELSLGEQSIPPMHVLTLGENGTVEVYTKD